MSSTQPHPILAKIDAFIEKNSLSRSAFGAEAVNDPKFVFDLEAGREPRRATLEKVTTYMRKTPAKQERARGAA